MLNELISARPGSAARDYLFGIVRLPRACPAPMTRRFDHPLSLWPQTAIKAVFLDGLHRRQL